TARCTGPARVLRQHQKVKLPLYHCTACCARTSCALRQNRLRVAQIAEAKLPTQHELRVAQDASARCARYIK
ncbi:hypothetical protein A2U01_0100498, partial [Trifolium medium]|nr:hypothetical protein [Trifolium medium]